MTTRALDEHVLFLLFVNSFLTSFYQVSDLYGGQLGNNGVPFFLKIWLDLVVHAHKTTFAFATDCRRPSTIKSKKKFDLECLKYQQLLFRDPSAILVRATNVLITGFASMNNLNKKKSLHESLRHGKSPLAGSNR